MMFDHVDIAQLDESPVHLRKVCKESPDFEYLVMSIKEHGLFSPILVRQTNQGLQIIKGLHRYYACIEAGLKEVPVCIITATDAEVEVIQMITSLHWIGVKQMEYGNYLTRMAMQQPCLTLRGMAKKLKIELQLIRDILSLRLLCKEATILVNDDKIILYNAWALTRLREENQVRFLNEAQHLKPENFYALMKSEVERLRDERRKQYRGQVQQKTCIAHINREFFMDGECDGTETEFVYADDPLVESLKGCKTIEEARVVLQEPAKVDYYWEVKSIQFADRMII